jgi:hypothetical protein
VTYLCRYVFLVLWSASPRPKFVMCPHWQSSTRGRSQISLEVREDSTIYCVVNPFMLCQGPWASNLQPKPAPMGTNMGLGFRVSNPKPAPMLVPLQKKNPQNSFKLFLNILEISQSLSSSVTIYFLSSEPCKKYIYL